MRNLRNLLYITVITALFSGTGAASYENPLRTTVLWQRGVVKTTVIDSIRNEVVLGEKKQLNRLRMHSYNRSKDTARELLAEKIVTLPVYRSITMQEIIEKHAYSQQQFSHLLQEKIVSKVYPLDFYETRCNAYVTFADIIALLPYRYPIRDFPTFDAHAHATVYTSLIIDTRGTDFTPMLMPSIYDEEGLELYGRQYIDPQSIHHSGIVLYVHSEEEALSHTLAGEHPYYTTAIGTADGNPVLSFKDVRRIFSTEENISFLKNCRVFFIIPRSGQ